MTIEETTAKSFNADASVCDTGVLGRELVEARETALLHSQQQTYRQAEIEVMNDYIEKLVASRTEQLSRAKSWTTAQYQIAITLAESSSRDEVVKGVLRSLVTNIAEGYGSTWGAFWSNSKDPNNLQCVSYLEGTDRSLEAFREISKNIRLGIGEGLPGRVWATRKAALIPNLLNDDNFPRFARAAESKLNTGVAFPILHRDRFFGVLEIATDNRPEWDLEALELLGRQIGQVLVRKETERERERLANILLCSSDAIITTSATGEIISWNKGAENLISYSKHEAVGSNLFALLCRKEDQALLESLESSLRQNQRVEDYETSIQDAKGGLHDVILFAVPWFSDFGDYEGCSLTFHDITIRKEAERRVSDFYSMVSHELRTPLTSIRGVLGLIENDTVEAGSEEGMELIAAATSSADRLIRLVNDMLDLKKIEAGKIDLNKTNIEVDELVSLTLSSLTGMAETSGVKLTARSIDQGSVYADWDKATQVITNLVSNAIKFTPRGGQVMIMTEPSDDCMRFRVIDNGPGIALSDLDELFDKFKQLRASDSSNSKGTGLGLVISKALVEEHGGKIGVRSSVGEGSEFWFDLPKSVSQALPQG